MSWEVFAKYSKKSPPPFSEFPTDWEWEDIGTVDEVQRMISAQLPDVDWDDDGSGRYFGNGFRLTYSSQASVFAMFSSQWLVAATRFLP